MDIVDIKFKEWTEGLNSTESRINIFEKVRDIPYFIDPTLWDFDEGPSKMLRLGKGSCTPKHYLLGRMFQKMGLGELHGILILIKESFLLTIIKLQKLTDRDI